jgi:uncharacterized membrane protein
MNEASSIHAAPAHGAAYHEAGTAEALTDRNVRTIVELERSARAARGAADRLADAIARFCGTLTFVWVHVAWFAAWILLNVWPGGHHPDPYPFTFLTLVVSLEAIFLSTFILISQNLENKVSERRSQLDLQINLLTEQENTKMLRMLKSIAEKVGADIAGDPELAVLEESTRPENLVAQIERASVEVGEMRREDDEVTIASTLSPARA